MIVLVSWLALVLVLVYQYDASRELLGFVREVFVLSFRVRV